MQQSASPWVESMMAGVYTRSSKGDPKIMIAISLPRITNVGLFSRRLAISVWITISTATLIFAQEASSARQDELSLDESLAISPGSSDDPMMEEVLITGSLLPKGNYESNAPITTINAEQFEVSNAINIEQLLNTLPQILTGEDKTSTFGFGWATADLRGLGTNRTLTLLDGKRLVPTFADGGTVDLNLVPPGIIDRVEILTGGASATYGSDAMAGVVNIITKEDFIGFELTTAGEITQQHEDAEIANVGLTFGTRFSDGDGHLMVHADLTDRSEVRFRDRDFSAYWNDTVRDENGAPVGHSPWRNWGSSNTAVFGPLSGPLFNFTNDGEITPYDQDQYGFVTTNHLDLQLPQRRNILFSKLSYEKDRFSLNAQIHVADVASTRPMPPVPFFGIHPQLIQNNPFLSADDEEALLATPEVSFLGSQLGIDFDGDGMPNMMPFFLFKWLEGLGETRWQVENEMVQANLGFEWDISDNWGLSGTLNRGDIEYDSKIGPAVVTQKMQQALVPDPSDPSGQSCLDASNGCFPYNIYGFDQASDEAKDFISTDIFRKNESELTVASLVLTGNSSNFFNMPAGPIGLALGLEFLERVSSYDTDPRVANGEISLFSWDDAAPLDEVTIDRTSAFFEMALPLLEGLPAISFLELELAGRYTEHSTIGATSAYKAALSWFPVDDVQIRGGVSESTRAPSIEEMYGDFGQEELNPLTDVDPCSAAPVAFNEVSFEDYNYVVGTREDCIATGVPEDAVYSEGLNIANLDRIPIYLGGSPNLNEETAKTFTVGIVWTPYDFDGFSASVDYFSIEVNDYIDRLPLATFNPASAIYRCYDRNSEAPGAQDLRPAYCAGLNRNEEGVLTSIDAGLRNLALHRVRGADFSISQRLDFADAIVDLNYVASYVDEKVFAVGGTAASVNCVGLFNLPIGGDACSRPVTKLKHRATASWMKGDSTLQLTWRHLSSATDGRTDEDYYVESVDAFNYFELSGNYNFQNGLAVTVGVRNLFDKSPPVLDMWNSGEANTYPNLYDVFGRSIFARLKYTFNSI